PFDEQWFVRLLTERQTRVTGQAPTEERQMPASPEQPPSQALLAFEPATSSPNPSRLPTRLLRSDWREPPGVSAFYGRAEELAELERWLLADHCRLVALLGMGGIGKTALAAQLVQQVAPHFECVLWRSLHNAPSLQDILDDWLPVLVGQHDLL